MSEKDPILLRVAQVLVMPVVLALITLYGSKYVADREDRRADRADSLRREDAKQRHDLDILSKVRLTVQPAVRSPARTTVDTALLQGDFSSLLPQDFTLRFQRTLAKYQSSATVMGNCPTVLSQAKEVLRTLDLWSKGPEMSDRDRANAVYQQEGWSFRNKAAEAAGLYRDLMSCDPKV